VWVAVLGMWQLPIVRDHPQVVLAVALCFLPSLASRGLNACRRAIRFLSIRRIASASRSERPSQTGARPETTRDEMTTYSKSTPLPSELGAGKSPESTSYGASELVSGAGGGAPQHPPRWYESDLVVPHEEPTKTVDRDDHHSEYADGRPAPNASPARSSRINFRVTSYEFSGASWTNAGPREENQDRALITSRLLAVADGVGGRSAGAAAAYESLLVVRATMSRPHANPAEAVLRANQALRARHSEDTRDRGRATTLDIVHFDEGEDIAGAHVGDSRVYVLPAGMNELARLTTDHSNGDILTRSIGGSLSVHPDVWIHEPSLGDLILVATDGLWKSRLDDARIGRIMVQLRGSPPEIIARALGEEALAYAVDNITVIVAEVVAAN
jgi:PPM family protein phosphatase